jgi:hypothetical protein
MNRSCTAAAGDFTVVTDDDYTTPQDRLEKHATGLLDGEKVVAAGTSRAVVDHIFSICERGNPYGTDRKSATEDTPFTESRA